MDQIQFKLNSSKLVYQYCIFILQLVKMLFFIRLPLSFFRLKLNLLYNVINMFFIQFVSCVLFIINLLFIANLIQNIQFRTYNRNQVIPKIRIMVEFTFDGLFKTTNKGLPTTSSLDPYTYLSLTFYVWSIILQITLLVVFISFLVLSINRVLNRIKNDKFNQEEKQDQSEEQQKVSQKQKIQHQEESHTNDNLIYKFDEEEEAKQKIEEQEVKQPQVQEIQNQDNQEIDSQTNQKFLQMDHKFLTFQPLLIGFVMMNNTFSMGPFGLVCLGLSLLSYVLFNIKSYGTSIKILQSIYMVPAILVLFSIYFSDLDMSS